VFLQSSAHETCIFVVCAVGPQLPLPRRDRPCGDRSARSLGGGEFVERVLQRWLVNSPSNLLRDPQRRAAVTALSGRIYLTVGDVDEFDLYSPTIKFSHELTAAGIDHELVITHGGHLTHAQEQMSAIERFCLSKLESARSDSSHATSRDTTRS
jgi:hypothetical protein